MSTFEVKKHQLHSYYNTRVINASLDPETYKSDLCNFFVLCYHLKDYIKSDPKCKISLVPYGDPESIVEGFVTSKKCLCICGAIATRYKHNDDKDYARRRGDAQFVEDTALKTVGMKAVKLLIHVAPNIESITRSEARPVVKRFEIEDDKGNLYDAVNLACDCMDAWNSFIIEHNL